MTPAFSINSIQNAMLSVRFPGSFAHTNIVPLPFGFSQPMEASPSHRASRRAWYCLHCSFTLSRGPSRAAIAAFWIGRNIPKSIWLRSFLRAEMISNEKADSGAGYVKGFGKAEKFNTNLPRTRSGKKTSTFHAIKDNVAVCIVMDN
jgi:hypothetical protein